MPYAIRRGSGEGCRFEVVVETTGKRVGCHPDRASARRHLAALYANVPEAKTISSLMDRESDFWANYRKTLVKAVTPTFTRIFLAGAKAALKIPAVEKKAFVEKKGPVVVTAVSSLPKNLPSIAKKAIKQYVNEWSHLIEDTTYEGVREAVLTSRATGGGVEAVIQAIAPLFAPERVQRIAVTETTRLFGRGAQASYEAMGLQEWGWSTVNDPWVCFPPGTMVMVNDQEMPIEQVSVGDTVKTMRGHDVVTDAWVHPATEMVRIDLESGPIFSTPDHRLWVIGSGWTRAADISSGDALKNAANEAVYVIGVCEFILRHTNNGDSFLSQNSFTGGAGRPDRMPVVPVNFKADAIIRQEEVQAIPSNCELLHEIDAQTLQGLTDNALQSCFANGLSVTGEGAELSLALPSSLNHSSTILTDSLGISASLALHRAVGVSVGYGLNHNKRQSTADTELGDSFSSVSAFKATEDLPLATGHGSRIKALPTRSAGSEGILPCGLVIAILRTINHTRIAPLRNGATTPLAFGNSRHVAASYHGQGAISIAVHDIKVKNDPTFFANGILVHNCGSPGKELTDNAISHLVFEEPCYDLDGKTFPIDQMFEPNHVNCLVEGTRVLSPSSILAATRRVYEGEVVTIRTTRGDELSVTPNHPVLTFAGWKPAGEIKEGDKIVGHSFSDASLSHVGVRSSSTHNPYEKQVPTPINEIWESLGVKSSMRHAVVPSSPEDFHGDGSYGKIDVVLPNSILGHSTDTPVGKPVEDGLFVFAGDDPLSGHSSGNESGVRILSSSPSGMGNTGIVEPLFRSKSSLLQKLRIGLRSDRGVPLKQCSTNGEPGTPEVASQAGLTLTGDVSLADFLDRKGMLVSPYTTLLVSEVIRIPRDVARHVYNLQTSDGFYVAEGIVTHNCRCFSVPIVTYGGEEKDWDPDLHPRDELGQFALAGGGSAVAEAPENTGGALPNGSLAIPGTTYSNRTNPTDSYYERVKALMAERGAPSFELDNVDIEREQIAKQYGGDFDMYHIDGTNIEVGVPLDRDLDPDSVHQAVETIRGLNEKLPPPGEVMVLLGRDLTEMGPGVQGVTTVPTTSDPDIRKGVGALMLISDNVVANPYQNAGEVYPGVARAEEVTAIQYVISHEWGHVVDRFPIEKEVDAIFGVVAGTDPETTPYVDAYLNRGTMELNALEAAIQDGKVPRGSQMDYAIRSEAMNFIALGAKENFAESIAEYVLSKEPGAAPMNEWTEKYLKEIGFLTPTGRVSRKKAIDFSLTTFIDDFVGPSQELPEVLKEWDEDLHPRDEAGRFTSGDGGIDVESGVAYVADMSMGGTYVGSRVVDEQEFVNKYQNAEVEHGLISTEDGRKIEVTSNNQGTIHLEKEAIRAMRNGDFIHNHPLPGIPLSGGDVVAAVQTGCKSITAVSSDGSISRMEEPKGGWFLGSKEDAQSAAMALAVFHPDYDANKPDDYIHSQNRALWAFARDTGAKYTYIPGAH